MAVYTSVSRRDLRQFLRRYSIGDLVSYDGISAGIENTNYALRTTNGQFILTLFEQTENEALPFCLNLMANLRAQGMPCAAPQLNRDDLFVDDLNGKPAVIVRHLEGRSVENPNKAQCIAVGRALAQLHLLTQDYRAQRANERGVSWHRHTAERISESLDKVELALVRDAIASLEQFARQELPHGVIHADLFRDNVLFKNDVISGLIDFYYAHTGPFIYDLAVTLTDWCCRDSGELEAPKALALIDAYNGVREIEAKEKAVWVQSLRAVALRFYLSRRHDALFPRDGVITRTKDPSRFRALLEQCASTPESFEQLVRERE